MGLVFGLQLGSPAPFELARTLVALLRAFELDRLTRPDAELDDLRRRLLSVAVALVPQALKPPEQVPQ